jgi:hypothetical protein
LASGQTFSTTRRGSVDTFAEPSFGQFAKRTSNRVLRGLEFDRKFVG